MCMCEFMIHKLFEKPVMALTLASFGSFRLYISLHASCSRAYVRLQRSMAFVIAHQRNRLTLTKFKRGF